MKRPALKRAGLFLLALAAALAPQTLAAQDAPFSQVERGRYLAVLGDCTACHTVPGKGLFAGGVPIDTPFGRLVAPNITPDRETGIGTWSEEDFQRVMSEGIGKGGYHLYGAMPYTAYTKVTAADNAAILAYLRTVEPVHNAVEPNQLPFPFNIRTILIGWNFLNFTKGEYVPDEAHDAQWNRGAYIVQGLGHCGTCHTPKTILGGDKDGQFLKGEVVDGWLAPDITGDRAQGIGKWSVEQIRHYLKTGVNEYDIASGPMAEVVKNSSQHWTDADLTAVATYLKSLTPADPMTRPPLRADAPEMLAGRALYEDRCAACHVGNGVGIDRLFPRLADAPLVSNADATSLIRVVLAGSRAGDTDARPTAPAMPSFARTLSDEDVAQILTYVRNSWGNAAPAVSAADVASARKEMQSAKR